jgi:hypothetical protein
MREETMREEMRANTTQIDRRFEYKFHIIGSPQRSTTGSDGALARNGPALPCLAARNVFPPVRMPMSRRRDTHDPECERGTRLRAMRYEDFNAGPRGTSRTFIAEWICR